MPSVSDSKIRSLMCVPLFDSERKSVGIMQIDTRDGRGRFEQDDLDLLAAVASQISVAVQNAQLHKALIKQREMEHELQFARQVMQSLLPEQPASVPGLRFLGVLRAGAPRWWRLLRNHADLQDSHG